VSPAVRLSSAPDLLPPPPAGQVYVDASSSFWRVKRVTHAANPEGFYLVHLECGPTLSHVSDAGVLGPRAFATLVRERNMRAHFELV
jgi:hypothetical protein